MCRQELPGKNTPEFTPEEEKANIVTHILGILFGIIAIPFLISLAAKNEDRGGIFSMSIYGLCFLMVFTFSTLYHSLKKERPKALCKKCDHISIYFLIAGTYTPIVRYYVYDGTGIVLLSILWFLVICGVLFESFLPKRSNFFSVIFYLRHGINISFCARTFFCVNATRYYHACFRGSYFILRWRYFLPLAKMEISSRSLALVCLDRWHLSLYSHTTHCFVIFKIVD
jgi:hemolysin III